MKTKTRFFIVFAAFEHDGIDSPKGMFYQSFPIEWNGLPAEKELEEYCKSTIFSNFIGISGMIEFSEEDFKVWSDV